MKRNIIISTIKQRIDTMDAGRVLIINDFLDIGNYDAVKNALSKLAQSGTLRREMRGIYKKPNFNKRLEIEVPASPHDIAKAIARINQWTIMPQSDAALNALGLTTQVPAIYSYVSDGPTKQYRYGNQRIALKKRRNKDTTGLSYRTGLVVESIKTIGKNDMNDNIRAAIARQLSDNEMVKLQEEGQRTTRWVNEEIVKISQIGGNDVRNSAISRE